IFSKDGTPYVKFYKENSEINQFNFRKDDIDIKILERIISLIKTKGEELTKSKYEILEFNGFKLVITPCLNSYLFLIYKSSLSSKKKEIIKFSQVVCSMIKSLYMVKDFRFWEGDLTLFDNLKKKLDLYLKMSGL
ncbi:MAG: hypothetical protein ACFFG0_35420, partial [Candidatus Thorarchaeota archaeon]